ncbi:hypothetical protein MJO28_011110 [Puccinia striiformis f. sp. tritici]|uniref:Uncharacterized protein n=1 Tax=Puccinia striiformis f. sp. tritici TaxID=168172 RepID=A0ACC0E1K1_9BASI|nr:hypothetical protein Pst134EA_020819 [Puccinia striiformis f. sp. tritici]KAH9447595.1 hypothetical protein Pst134EB_021608 [Puccinia striiformis f. sp. tritici]KAH9456911.1 hypothetical protein Pst134EA_020819 [Puccinia striiformis f. sp. tritici]KAI7943582.1 hypothetical protein MJO28_011110 [Puccinia striiformis f. sp. tritici]KAI7946335.1 hypothetical protein MJO29_010862 [Puccinia striiformis f. sp. tritici]
MSNLAHDSASTDDNIVAPRPKMTSIGALYSGLHHISSNCDPSLYFLFVSSMIYTRDYENVIKLNDFFFPLLKSPPFTCHSLRVPNTSPYATIAATPIPEKSLRRFPSVTLQLKVGMPIRLTRSISTNYEIDKGARLLILKINSTEIFARLLVNDQYGCVVRIEPIITPCRDPINPYLSYVRLQFPVEPAFASCLFWQIEDSVRFYALFKSHQLY